MGGIGSAITLLGIIEILFKLFSYIAFISLSIKGIQALNVYIDKAKR